MKKWLAIAACVISSAAFANDAIRLIVPFAAGGPGDRVARMAQKDLQAAGRTVLVENRPGGNGDIALNHMLQVGKTETVLMIVGTPLGFATKPQLDNIGIEAVADIGRTPLIITAPRGGKISSMQQLLALPATEPVNYGNAGRASLSYLIGETIKSQSQKNLVGVSYPGGARMLVDLLGGRLDIGISNMGDVVQHIETQQLVALAVTGSRRVSELPSVPTLAELGVKDSVLYSHLMLLGLESNSRADVAFVQSTLTASLNNAATAQPYLREGLTVAPGSKSMPAQWWQREVLRLRDVIARNRIQMSE